LALEDALDDLGEVRQQLHEAIEVIDEGFAMFDAEDRLILCNDRYRAIWSVGTQILGSTFEQIARARIDRGDLPEANSNPEQWIASRLARHRNPREPEILRTADGVWLQVNERRTSDGGIVGLYTDITEIKAEETRRREQALAEKSALQQSTIDSLDQGVLVLDAQGRLEVWNRRFTQLLEMQWAALKQGDDLSGLAGLEDLAQVGLPHSAELRTRNGSMLDLRVTPMPDGGRVATFTDITERQEKEQQLLKAVDRLSHANTELERFAYVASHDLREPLRTIVSFTQLLQKRYPQEGEAQEYVDLVIGAGKRMNELICGLLDYSRVSGQSNPFRPCDMVQIAGLVLDNLRGSIEQSGAVIDLAPLPLVTGDAVQLVQLLQNLISNAIKYCRPDSVPQISITARKLPDGDCCFQIEDNGIGIDDGEHDIYEIFRRLHHNSAYPGAGIGLAVCRRIVEHHGGKLWHEPSESGGTRFLFTLTFAENDKP